MSRLTLLRLEENETETISVLQLDLQLVGFALELPWQDNRQNVSRIPAGLYELEHHDSPSRGKTLLVHGVPGRNSILIHAGNTHHDTKGCILPGQRVGRLSDTRAVLNSRLMLAYLLEHIVDGYTLRVYDPVVLKEL